MHDYEMRIGHSLLWSHVFSPYYTTRGLFELLCTYMYFIETYSSSLIKNTPQWRWFWTVRTNSTRSAQRVSREIVCYQAALATFLASSSWAFLPSKGRHCLGKAEIRFRETAEPAVSLPSQSSKVGSAYEAGHVELETHLVASQTYDATRCVFERASQLPSQIRFWGNGEVHLVRIDGPVIDIESPGTCYPAIVDVLHGIKDFHLRAKQECIDDGVVRIWLLWWPGHLGGWGG